MHRGLTSPTASCASATVFSACHARTSAASRRTVSMTGWSALMGCGLPGRPAWNAWDGFAGSDASRRKSLQSTDALARAALVPDTTEMTFWSLMSKCQHSYLGANSQGPSTCWSMCSWRHHTRPLH